MKTVNLNQAGTAWHNWRKEGIGGSDACAVMGTVSWKSRDTLTYEKSSGKAVDIETPIMKRGKDLEPDARALYEALTGIKMAPVCIQHDTIPWLRASLDGWNEELGIILEIKCPYSPWPHRKALYGHEIPHYYKPQVQHQLLAAGITAKKLHYFSYTDDEKNFSPDERFALVEIDHDYEYQARLLEEEQKVMEIVRSKKHRSNRKRP